MSTSSAPARRRLQPGGVWWVKAGPEPHLATCGRCGGVEAKPALPAPIGRVLAAMRAALRRHRDCEAAP